jgi:hypothetical protein
MFGFAGGIAPRLSSAAVICNKSVSYTQDARTSATIRRTG